MNSLLAKFLAVFITANLSNAQTTSRPGQVVTVRPLRPLRCPPMGPGPVVFPPPYKPGPPFKRSDVNFTIATRTSPQPQPLDPNNLKSVKDKKTIIAIGDWDYPSRVPSSYLSDITNAYLNKSDYNVISVHDEKLMNVSFNASITYREPIDQVPSQYVLFPGRVIADLIVSLYKQNQIPLSRFHIVGHGLGAHIGGAAGLSVFKSLNKKIYRITALEVIRRGFENVSPEERLDKMDAEVVDVIHTDAGDNGLNQSIGSADFWVNGGESPQPVCCFALAKGTCSYGASVSYFISTLTQYPKARKCDSELDFAEGKCDENETAIFGDNYKGYPQGNFYLDLLCGSDGCKSDVK